MAKTTLTAADFQKLNLLATHAGLNAPHKARFHNFGPDLEGMFTAPVGHADERDDYRSALSPSAYLVDLVRLVGEHIKSPADGRALPLRRPDVFELELSREKAEQVVPYLEIVKRVMRTYLEETLQVKPSALAALAQSHFPFTLPFHLPLTEIRSYLNHFQIELADIYAAFEANTEDPAWAAETLNLAPGEMTYLATKADAAADPDKAYAVLNEAYGVETISGTSTGGLDEAATFLTQTDLTQAQLEVLLKVGLPGQQSGDGVGLRNLDNLDYLNRFIRLANRLGWSFDELDCALTSIRPQSSDVNVLDHAALKTLAKIESLRSKYKLPVDVLCSFWADIRTTPALDRPDSASLFDRVFNTPPFYVFGMAQAGDAGTVTLAAGAAAADGAYRGMQITITAGTGAGQTRTITAYKSTTNVATVDSDWTTALDATSRYAITHAYAAGTARRGAKRSLRLAATAAAANDAYRGMQVTITSGTGRGQTRSINAYKGVAKVARVNKDWETVPDETSRYVIYTENSLRNVHAALFGTLNVGDEDGHALLDHLLATAGSFTPDPPSLTRLYRLRKLAQVLGLPVPEYLALLTLITKKSNAGPTAPAEPYLAKPEVSTVDDVLAVSYWADWLTANRLNAFQLQYLTSGVLSAAAARAGVDTRGQQMPIAPALVKKAGAGRIPLLRYMAKAFALSAAQFQAVLSSGATFGIAKSRTPEPFSLDALRQIADFKQLTQAFALRGNVAQTALFLKATTDDAQANSAAGLLKYLQQPGGGKPPTLAMLSGWDADQIVALAGQLGVKPPYTLRQLAAMRRCFELASKLGVHIQLLIDLYKLHGAAEEDASASWPQYQKTAQAFLSVVRSGYSPDEWSKTFDPIRARLNEMERDALTAFLLRQLQSQFADVKTLQDLSDFLLVDVQMSGCAQTTRVKEAIDCLQIYIQRCRLNLEAGTTMSEAIPDQMWDWMGRYRLWQANRKVFFYPENYLDPTLRTSEATPEFKELQSGLLQGDVTRETVEDAYLAYFDKLDALADLEIVDGCYATVHNPNSGRPRDAFFLLGRTATEPPAYYQRQAFPERVFGGTAQEVGEKTITLAADETDGAVGRTITVSGGKGKPQTRTISAFDVATKLATVDEEWGPVPFENPRYELSAASGRLTGNINTWNPWQKVDVNIPADHALPVYVAERLYVFWVEHKTITDRDDSSKPRTTRTLATIKFSYQRVSGTWMQPQVLAKDVDVATLPQSFRLAPGGPANEVISLSLARSKESATLAVLSRMSALTSFTPVYPHGATGQGIGGYDLADAADRAFAFDYDGSGKQDHLVLYRPGAGKLWMLGNRGGTFEAVSTRDNGFGGYDLANPSDRVFAFDYEGNGRLNYLVLYRPIKGNNFFQIRTRDANDVPALIPIDQVKVGAAQDLLGSAAPADWFTDGRDRAFAFDYDGSGKQDHLLLYRPGAGRLWLFRHVSGSFQPVIARDNGFGNYDLSNPSDRVFAFDYEGSGRLNYVALYRPIKGNSFFQITNRSAQNVPAAVPADWFTDERDRAFAFDYDGSGKPDHLLLYRPGAGKLSILKNLDGTFEPVYSSDSGIGGYDLASEADRIFAFDYESTGKQDHLVLYRPGAGKIWILKNEREDWRWSLPSATTRCVRQLHQRLAQGGLDALLTPDAQGLSETPGDENPDPAAFDLSRPYALYFREVFFHIPYLIADTLQAHQHFEEAKRWYEYIFDPLAPPGRPDEHPSDRYWQYLPFRGHTSKRLDDAIRQSQQVRAYEDDPFDPFAIAEFRPGAYQKALAMRYVDNLVAWGDSLYTLDGWENLNAATTLYGLAAELLGPRPQTGQSPARVNGRPAPGALTAGRDAHQPDERLAGILKSPRGEGVRPFLDVPTFFFVPENDQFADYWSTVERRLYQIRHCMNLQGVVRQLPLFEPPIDPRQLLRAMAAGGSISAAAAAAGPAVQVPHYRFAYLLERARQVTSELKQLGEALLGALEKQDAEQLAVLRNTYEGTILTLTTLIKQKQQDEIRHSLESLQQSLAAAQARYERYQNWATDYLSPGEQTGLGLTQKASSLKEAASIITSLSGIAYAIPNIYGLADGGMNFGKLVEVEAGALGFEASILEWAGQMAMTKANYDRRQADWQLQADLAGYDVQQINAQIAALGVRQDMTDQELAIHQQSITQNREIDQFYRQKFTSQELYQWMVSRLGGVYFQTYQLALDLVRMTERAFQYERVTDDSYVSVSAWDDLKKGLLAGDALALNLNQLEKAYVEQNQRELEIEKNISLLQLDPQALLDLKASGRCTFELTEQLFDYDFPGHYRRRIKSVSLSIPAVVGPYQNISATLIQHADRVVLTPDPETVKFLLVDGQGQPPDSTRLRSSWRPDQQIAISRGVDDAGMSQLDFRDERYLPFEGTGAVSTWELSLPKGANRDLDFSSVWDVIMNLRYTALDGGEKFRQHVYVQDQIKTYAGHRLFSLRQECPREWQRFVGGSGAVSFTFPLTADRLALNCDPVGVPGDGAGKVAVRALWEKGVPGAGSMTLSISVAEAPLHPESLELDAKGEGSTNPLTELIGDWRIVVTPGDAASLAKLLDIVLIVPFQGTLKWS